MEQQKFLKMLANLAEAKKLPAAHVLFEMGDHGTTMYVVKSGALRIQIGDLVFETVVEGGIVGEMALLDDETHLRSATVIAATDSEVVEVGRDQLLKMVHDQPQLSLEFCKVMIRRLRKTTVLTYHDSITGLPNRFRFQELCRAALTRARRQNAILGVLFVDVDHFQSINESLGFALGDELLGAVAARLRETLEDAHPVARLLAMLDLFVLWWLVVLAVGVSVVYGAQARRTAVAFVGVYLAFALVMAAAMAVLGGTA